MSGNYRGKVEMWINSGFRIWNVQTIFTNLYNFWNSHPNATMIASNYGASTEVLSPSTGIVTFSVQNGSATINLNNQSLPVLPAITAGSVITFSNFTGTSYTVQTTSVSSFTINTTFGGSTNASVTATISSGPGYYDGYQPFGQNAWFVVRLNATAARAADVYHLFQWYGSSGFNTGSVLAAPGLPALVNGTNSSLSNCEIIHSCAIGVGGSGGSALSVSNGYGNPWKGTTNNNGSDTKGSTVWGTPISGTSALIWPRSNSSGGSFATNAQNMGIFMAGNASDSNAIRAHIVADDDSFCMFTDAADNNNYNASFSGLYNPRPNITITIPYMVIDSGQDGPVWNTSDGTVYGDIAGTNRFQGGIISASIANSVRSLQLDALPIFTTDIAFSPNRNYTLLQFDEFDYCVGIFEPLYYGFLGQLDWIRLIINVQTCYTRSDFTKIFIGNSTVSNAKFSIPWDSQNNTVPRTGISRSGINFVSANP